MKPRLEKIVEILVVDGGRQHVIDHKEDRSIIRTEEVNIVQRNIGDCLHSSA